MDWVKSVGWDSLGRAGGCRAARCCGQSEHETAGHHEDGTGVAHRPALALLNEGRGFKDVARILKVLRATLRCQVEEAGREPVETTAA